MDIQTYLQVIGVDRSQLIHGADPESLKLICKHHVRALPFNTLPIVCGHPVDPDLNVAGIAERMLSKRWGGVCFEHVALLGAVLERLGFDVAYLGGEVWTQHNTWTPPLAHASLLVSFPDRSQYYCDVGFPLRPLEPLLLVDGKEQQQSDGRCFVLERQRPVPEESITAPNDMDSQTQSGPSETGHQGGRTADTYSDTAPEADRGGEPAGVVVQAERVRVAEATAAAEEGGGYWTLQQLEQGDLKVRHRFWLRPRALSDFSGPARCLADPAHRFSNGWLMAACRPDGALVTLAVGHWAGSAVPEDKAKYVCRREVPAGVAGSGAPQQHVQHTALLTRGSAALWSLVEREFLIRTEELGCTDLQGAAEM